VEIGEDSGLVPSREWHERHSKGGFQPGFTLSTAVGQKDIRATPLQMAMVLAQVVNGGRHLHPFLVDRVEDEHGTVVRSMRRDLGEAVGIPAEYLNFLKQAMIDTVQLEHGTGHNARLESIIVGGKTGTAEALQVKKGVDPYVARWLAEDHAWFIAFAPAKEPRIAVTCIVEHGGFGGQNAAPIVSKVIYKLFSRDLIPE
jgi:penicillin-binding protein 2